MMSSEHAVILCRAGRDELHDMLSTNGTFLNEKYVERDGADLIDGALIKTGATIFEFRKFTSGGEKRPEGQRTGYYGDEGDAGRSRSQGETSI
jgi:pSer/pThr/pTyr-binding forkhead associated (FHA) protein